MKKVLFISHDASRTGAPIIFLNFLRWFKKNSEVSFRILLKDGGSLEQEFTTIASTSIFNSQQSTSSNVFTKILERLGLWHQVRQNHLKQLKRKLAQENIGLIYANTITTGEVLEFLADLKCPVICHVHELEHWIDHRVSSENRDRVKRYTQHYIAVSQAVKFNLVHNQQIPAEKISVIYESIPIKPFNPQIIQQQRIKVCQELHIPQNAKIVCASGTTDWRKGADLFVQLAQYVVKQSFDHPVYFLWVGGRKGGIEYSQLQHDVKKAGLEGKVLFVGEQPNPLDFFAACDVFTLLSREDPYPLVCLEAASLEKPIICFDNSGGEPEFVEDDCGFVVPYLDLETMAVKVISLINSPDLCQRLGSNARRKVEERHAIEQSSVQIKELIEQFLVH